MLERFYPNQYIKSIKELPVAELQKRKIKALVFDIDNTIAPYDVAEADEEMLAILENLKKAGFQICLLSNNNQRRVEIFNRKISALAVHKAGKPGVKKLREAMKKMGTDQHTTAFIGDQVFTDIYCGNRAGLFTILTMPVCNRDQLVTKVKRGAERLIIKAYLRRQRDGMR